MFHQLNHYVICHPLKSNFIFLFLLLFCLSCNVNNQGLVSRTYHNITAKYNAFFLAKQRMNETERKFYEKRIEDYNRVLDVIHFNDSNTLKAENKVMEDCIKKAATVPNRHDNSKFLDDSYLLIGKARFYLRDYENAVNTFKYINTKGTLSEVKKQALIELMRTYIQMEDLRLARTVLNELTKRPPQKHLADFLITRGHFYRIQNDYVETVRSLQKAVEYMPKSEQRARVHFILGQLYQRLQRDDLSYKHYRKVLKNNPSYELAFHSKLYISEVAKLSSTAGVKKVKHYFKRLLRDSKNKDYQDKIYYEMALFELRQKNTNQAVKYLNESLAANKSNQVQKAYTYLKLAEVNYQYLQKYELAKTYYDSVMISLPPTAENYSEIKKRQKVLDEFVKQLTIYRTNDSLIRLSQMPKEAMEAYISERLLAEESQRQREQDSIRKLNERKEKLKKQEKSNLEENKITPNAVWYFYNPSQVTAGQREFVKIWGNRPLEDDWRRSRKQVISSNAETTPFVEIDEEEFKKREIQKRVDKRKEDILAALPKNVEEVAQANKKIEDAGFQLGKIYKFKLSEPSNAIHYLEDLLKRFPATKYEAESLYFLYLLYGDTGKKSDQEKAKSKLIGQYPNSSFAKIITNPNYLAEAKENEAKIKEEYKKAYTLYEQNKLEEAKLLLKATEEQFPENLQADKFKMLHILINARQYRNKDAYKIDLEQFLKDFPESDLVDYTKNKLEELKEQ